MSEGRAGQGRAGRQGRRESGVGGREGSIGMEGHVLSFLDRTNI